MKNAFLFIFTALLVVNLDAQQKVADSLISLAETKSGIEKADLLNDLAENLLDTNPDKSIVYAEKALEIWEAENDATNAFYSLLFISNAYSNMGNHDSALQVLIDAHNKYEDRLGPLHAAQLNMHLGMVYKSAKLFEKALQHQLIALEQLSTTEGRGNKTSVKMLEMNIQQAVGDLFNSLENYSKALDHYDKALELSIQRNDSLNMAFIYNSIGIAYEQQKKYSAAIENYFLAMNILERLGHVNAIGNIKVNISLLYYFKGEYDRALTFAKEALTILENSPSRYALAINLSTIGRIYLKMNEADKAIDYIMKSYQMGVDNGYTDLITDSYDFLGQYNALKGNFEKAYNYNRKFVQSKDSIYNLELSSKIHELQTRYETEKKEQEIELLKRDAEIKELKLRRQRTLLFGMSGVVLLLTFMGFLWYRSNRQKQKLAKTEMDKRNLQTEQKLLRAQINPHFMFNALNSVQSYISANDTLKAMTYLAKFSQLMRYILENSRKSMITLEEEVTTLKLYMELEAMRFSNSFKYQVEIQEGLIPSRVYIPPMLVQPFVENSIKHGFRDRDEKGEVMVSFVRDNGMITCTIEDNGIGREKSMAMKTAGKSGHKSLGMQVTHERLIAMNKDRNLNVSFNIEDLVSADGKPAGTRVLLDMPYETE